MIFQTSKACTPPFLSKLLILFHISSLKLLLYKKQVFIMRNLSTPILGKQQSSERAVLNYPRQLEVIVRIRNII